MRRDGLDDGRKPDEGRREGDGPLERCSAVTVLQTAAAGVPVLAQKPLAVDGVDVEGLEEALGWPEAERESAMASDDGLRDGGMAIRENGLLA